MEARTSAVKGIGEKMASDPEERRITVARPPNLMRLKRRKGRE